MKRSVDFLRRMRRLLARGFSLLEVMVSVAILGLALTVILSAQGGLSAGNRTAENQSVAAGLVRCHMTELEERLLKLGYPEIDEIEEDLACCNDVRNERFTCRHEIEKIELPQINQNGGAGDGGGLNLATAASGITNTSSLNLDGGGGLAGVGSSLMTQMGGGAGAGGLLDMVMGLVYPSLKPMMEMSIRRVTVSVRWREGINPREITVVQFVTNPARAGFMQGNMMGDGGMPLSDGGSVSPAGSGSPTRVTPGPATGGGVGGGAGGARF